MKTKWKMQIRTHEGMWVESCMHWFEDTTTWDVLEYFVQLRQNERWKGKARVLASDGSVAAQA